jgi:hypothetical protein
MYLRLVLQETDEDALITGLCIKVGVAQYLGG